MILVFDSALQLLAMIDDYEYLSWTRNWRSPGRFDLRINRYKANVEHLQKDYYVARYDGDEVVCGRIAHKEIGLTDEGKLSENWVITGYDLGGFMANRLALHNTSAGNGYDEQLGIVAETAMRHYVDVNAINPADLNRKIDRLVLESDLGRGSTVNSRARFQVVSEVLEGISLASSLGWGILLDLSVLQFVFRVYEGRNLSPSQAINPPVIFSPEFDNVKMLGYRWSSLDSQNVAIVAGQGQKELRTIATVTKDGLSYTGADRREMLVDARDMETVAQLTQRGNEQLAEVGDETVLEVEFLQNGPFKYREDFRLGDIVRVEYPSIASMDTRIIGVTEELTPERGSTLKFVIGREYPDIISKIKNEFKKTSPEVRR